MNRYQRSSSVARQPEESRRWREEAKSKQKTIQDLQERLSKATNIIKVLNDTNSKLNEQAEIYLTKISYEKEKNRQRSDLFAKREKDLLSQISNRNSTISKMSKKEKDINSMLNTREKAIEEAYRQFDISTNSLREQLQRSQEREKTIENTLLALQKELYDTKNKLAQYENKGKVTDEMLKVFQNILAEKESLIQHEKAKNQEYEHTEVNLNKKVITLGQELKAMKMNQEEELLNSLRSTMDSKFSSKYN